MSLFKFSQTFHLVLLLLIAGCSNTSDSTSSDSSTGDSQPTAPAVGASTGDGTSGDEGHSGDEMHTDDMYSETGMDSPAAPAAGNQPVMRQTVVERPEDPLNWTTLHISAAIEERDLKVIEALGYYIDDHRGEDQSAHEIVAWLDLLNQPPIDPAKLKPANRNSGSPGAAVPDDGHVDGCCGGDLYDVPDVETADEGHIDCCGMYDDESMYGDGTMMGGNRGKNNKDKDERIAEALIDGLLAIHSLTSYQAARDLLQGDLELPFPPEKTASWTMKSLIKHVEGAHDPAGKILQQTVENPKLIRSGSGDFDAFRLKEVALQEHWTNAVAVMDGLMGLQSSSLGKPQRRNNNDDMYGGEMYESCGTCPGEGLDTGTPGNQTQEEDSNIVNPVPENLVLPDYTQEQALAARHYLWSPDLVNELAQRLNESETLMKDPALLLLAAQLPTTPTRFAFQNFLKRNWLLNEDWTRNPSSFIKYDTFKDYMRDPGLVITLKELPREQTVQPNNSGGDYGEYGCGETPQPNNNRQNQDPEELREQRVKQLWFETSEKFTLALMDRMLEAAENGFLPESNLDELDIKLHRDASITVDSRLELALGEPSAAADQDTRDKTVVNYIRIESSELDQRAVTHYKTQLRKEQQFLILRNNGMWLSAPVSKDRQTGELVSVDVLLSKNQARPLVGRNDQPRRTDDIAAPPPNANGGNQTFVIEILVVRIPDPATFLAEPKETALAE